MNRFWINSLLPQDHTHVYSYLIIIILSKWICRLKLTEMLQLKWWQLRCKALKTPNFLVFLNFVYISANSIALSFDQTKYMHWKILCLFIVSCLPADGQAVKLIFVQGKSAELRLFEISTYLSWVPQTVFAKSLCVLTSGIFTCTPFNFALVIYFSLSWKQKRVFVRRCSFGAVIPLWNNNANLQLFPWVFYLNRYLRVPFTFLNKFEIVAFAGNRWEGTWNCKHAICNGKARGKV